MTSARHAGPRRTLWRRLVPPWSERKRLLRRDIWTVLAGSYAAIAASYLIQVDFRTESMLPVLLAWGAAMVRTFLFHLGLFVLAVTLLAAALHMWRALVASLPLLVITLGPAVAPPRPPPTEAGSPGDVLRVMSVNAFAGNRQPAALLDEILASDVDLLLIQEYTPTLHALAHATLLSRLPHAVVEPQTDCFGLAMYSRRPFVGPVETHVPLGVADNPQMRAVIELDGRELTIYNVHLFPPSSLDYVKEQRRGFADLLDHLTRELLRDDRATLVAGDFNFTNESPMGVALRGIPLRDVQTIAGRGRGATWPNLGPLAFLPGVRIDHLYVTESLLVLDAGVGKGSGSDHRPVLAAIAFRQYPDVGDARGAP